MRGEGGIGFALRKKITGFFSASSSGFGGEREEAYSKKILRVRTLLCCCFCFVLFVLLYIRQRRECHEKENINLGNFQALFQWYNLIMKWVLKVDSNINQLILSQLGKSFQITINCILHSIFHRSQSHALVGNKSYNIIVEFID